VPGTGRPLELVRHRGEQRRHEAGRLRRAGRGRHGRDRVALLRKGGRSAPVGAVAQLTDLGL
jgi:hypothetical protein